ncbi:ankyrin repeat domain-containing protein [soil metagenome]
MSPLLNVKATNRLHTVKVWPQRRKAAKNPQAKRVDTDPKPNQIWFLVIACAFLTFSCIQPIKATIMHEELNGQLITAAERGDTPTVLRLLKQGANINGQDARGRTPMMAATHGEQTATVQALIEAGADINLRDNRTDNPFLYAGAEGLLDILKLLIAAHADTKLTNRYGGTALIPAAERGHVEVVKTLLTQTDVNVNHINNLGWTALLEAIVLSDGGVKHQQIVQLLVDHGADVNIADKEGVTPLQHARARGFKAIEQILVQASAR